MRRIISHHQRVLKNAGEYKTPPNMDSLIMGFLSAAPRVSTLPDAELGGPRSHILGVIYGVERLGVKVKRFIVGDRVPAKWRGQGSGATVSGHVIRTLAADIIRLGMGLINRRRAWRELGDHVDYVYERACAMQSLGGIFKQHGVPWVIDTTALYYYESKTERGSIVLDQLAKRIELEAYQSCDILIVESEALRDLLVDEGITADKIMIMPVGVDTHIFNPADHHPRRLFTHGLTVGFVGTLWDYQALDILMQAVHIVRQEGMDINIVIVGDGVMYEEWNQLADQLGIAEHVRFVGQVSNQAVPDYILGCDIGYSGLSPSPNNKTHFSALKLYEYMAMQKPVLVSDIGEGPSVIRHGQTGFVFQAGEIDALVHALRQAWGQREQLPAMGTAARHDVITHYDWSTRLEPIMARVTQLVNQD